MTMTWIWAGIVLASTVYGILNGTIAAVGTEALEGAKAAFDLCLSIGGPICLWSGLLAVMRECGMLKGLSRLLRPVLSRLFPKDFKNPAIAESLSANVSANLLGLGNAATPMGMQAAQLMARGGQTASDGLCMLVVLNTASIQLIPSTVAAVRAAAGSSAPFDILPAVWLTSIGSVAAGLRSAQALRRVWK